LLANATNTSLSWYTRCLLKRKNRKNKVDLPGAKI